MDKKLLLAMALSTITVFGLQYLLQKYTQPQNSCVVETTSTNGFRVPASEEISTEEFNKEIDFIDQKISQKEELINIETDLCKYSFSNFGGILQEIVYKKRLGKGGIPLKTIFYKDFFHKEEGCFLLAFEGKTPFFYELISNVELIDKYELAYKTTLNDWVIKKIYTLYKNNYRIDLKLEFEATSTKAEPLTSRIIFPAPYLAELENDTIAGFAYNPISKSIEKNLTSKVYEDIFGTEDRYFANCMIEDKEHFARLAYYKKLGENNLYSILRSPKIAAKSTFNLAFYFGPKDIQDLKVDPRLEGLLNFGMLSWLCKLLLEFLEFLYKYLHNYGLAIIVLTILIRIPLIPLSMKSAAVMERYQRYMPQINKIRQKYKDNIQLQHVEVMKFHKEHNLSPAAQMVGCLPLLIDMPIMLALYKVLGNYMDLYQAPFVGWIVDLSSKDPYYILPLMMGASMLWQQSLTPIKDDKQKVIMTFMAILMTAIFSSFAAGLVLYWLTKNLLTIIETYFRKQFLPKLAK